MQTNDKGLIYLDRHTLRAIFDCVYGLDCELHPATKELLRDKMFRDLVKLLLVQQEYNYRYRQQMTTSLFPLFDSTVGPMESNSDGTTLWLALGLAIKELYGFRRETFKELLQHTKLITK